MILSEYINQKINKDPISSVVRTWVDPNIIDRAYLENWNNKKNEANSFLINAQFLNSTTSKKSRLRLIKEKLKSGEIRTIQEIMHELSVTRATAIAYCKELKISVWDVAKNKFVEFNKNTDNQIDIDDLVNSHVIYYDKDASLPDAKIITKYEHIQAIIEAQQKIIDNNR